jgi:YD repeat-containing protein
MIYSMNASNFIIGLAAIIVFASCEIQEVHTPFVHEDIPTPHPAGIPKIKTERYDDETWTYVYDDQGRISEEQYADHSVLKYHHAAGQVTRDYLSATGELLHTARLLLNADGLCKEYSENGSTRKSTFTYDNDKRLIKSSHFDVSGVLFREWFHFYQDGNRVKDSTYVISDGSWSVWTHTFYEDILSTIEDDNRGIYWTGMGNTNTLKTRTVISSYGHVNVTLYGPPVLDAHRRVIYRTSSGNDSVPVVQEYSYY